MMLLQQREREKKKFNECKELEHKRTPIHMVGKLCECGFSHLCHIICTDVKISIVPVPSVKHDLLWLYCPLTFSSVVGPFKWWCLDEREANENQKNASKIRLIVPTKAHSTPWYLECPPLPLTKENTAIENLLENFH